MPTIMIVDDDANIRAVLKYRFEREDYTVRLASNGLEALAEVGSQRPDVIILDLMMPHMDGLQFLSLLKNNPQSQCVPVIVLTALGRTPYDEITRQLGAAGLVVKPFSPRHLVEEVKKALDGACISTERRWGGSQESNQREDLLELAKS
ncbi:MAG: response regulator [Chloroflexota bacterium]|nr:response regulator [Anaerolineae bacterium]